MKSIQHNLASAGSVPQQSFVGADVRRRDRGSSGEIASLRRRLQPKVRGLLWFILLHFLCVAGPASALDLPLRWRFSNPLPHGNNVVDMAYLPGAPGVWVQVAERGQIYTSSDLDLWIPRASGTTEALRAVTFLGQRVIVTGAYGTVLYADVLDHFQRGSLSDQNTNDWLESVAASPSLLVAVGDNGAVYTSSNGAQWQRRNAGTTTWLTGVAYGAGTFATVGDAGFIATSANGTNWTPRASGTATNLHRVAYAGTTRFTAVGQGGVTLTSLDAGASWFSTTTGASNDLHGTTTVGSSARLVLGAEEVRLNEGTGWSNELAKSNGPPAWTYYTGVGLPNFFSIAGQTGLMAEGYKTNASSFAWQSVAPSPRHWLWDVTYAGNLYVSVGDRATVMTSGDGVNWSLELVPQPATNSIFLGVGGNTNLLVAVGDLGNIIISPNLQTNLTVTNTVGSTVVVTNVPGSTLGVIWFALPRLGSNDLQGVAWGQGLYVVTGHRGRVFTSPDGTNWTRQTTPVTNFLSGVTAWPGGMAAVGDDGAIITSPDGINWTARAANTTNWLYRVRYLGTTLVAVGQNGTIRTSHNGTNWVARVSGTTQWLHDVTRIDNTWLIVGAGGTVLASTNLVNWMSLGTITGKGLYGAATDSRQLIAVGLEGVILRSPVQPDPTPISILNYSRFLSTNGLTAQNLFLFVGKPDQQFTLDYRSDFTTNRWVAGPQLEFYDSAGTLLYLETMPAASAPRVEFYQGTLTE